MKTNVLTLDAVEAGNIDLDEAIFGITPRVDILHRVVNWQLAKRRAGTHAVQFRSDVSRTGARFGKQKGGGARHGPRSSNIFVGGGRAFGPIPRDHGFDLPKKIRKLGLKAALSSKQADGKLIVVDVAELKEGKTKELIAKLEKLGLANALFVGGHEVDANFNRAVQNIPNIDVLPSQGANVYDILRRHTLVLTKAAVANLEERLK